MASNKCTDSTIGELRHAYEIGALSPEDAEKFEIHLLGCDSCFQEVSQFDEAATLIRTDMDIRREVRQATVAGEREGSLVRRLLAYLWPETPLVLKPAVSFFVLALLIYPAYLGLKSTGETDMRQIQTISLIPSRTAGSAVLQAAPGQDGLISFVYPGAEVGRNYRVVIETTEGEEVMSTDEFSGFDEYEMGRIVVGLGRLDRGSYRLVISDPSATDSVREQVYVFEVSR